MSGAGRAALLQHVAIGLSRGTTSEQMDQCYKAPIMARIHHGQIEPGLTGRDWLPWTLACDHVHLFRAAAQVSNFARLGRKYLANRNIGHPTKKEQIGQK